MRQNYVSPVVVNPEVPSQHVSSSDMIQSVMPRTSSRSSFEISRATSPQHVSSSEMILSNMPQDMPRTSSRNLSESPPLVSPEMTSLRNSPEIVENPSISQPTPSKNKLKKKFRTSKLINICVCFS